MPLPRRGDKMSNGAKETRVGDNTTPEVELIGPHGNTFRVYITDEDGDIVALTPAQTRRLIKKLQQALEVVSWERYGKYKAAG